MPTRKETGLKRVAAAKERVEETQQRFEMVLLRAHDFWGCSWREIGQAAGIPYGTAQSAAMRAKARYEAAQEEQAQEEAEPEAAQEQVA